MSAPTSDAVESVKDTIYRACLFLDDQRWDDWLDLCDEDFEYVIKAFSPEINYDMTYMFGTRADMTTMTGILKKHNSDHSPFKRHVTVYTVDVDEKAKIASAVTSLVVYQNMLDGNNSHIDSGESRLFLVGRYLDRFRLDGAAPKFIEREVRLDTRRLDQGSHWPI